MDVLLILNGRERSTAVLVRLHTKALVNRVKQLISEARNREAFKLIVSKAQVRQYIPSGGSVIARPELTLVEDANEITR